MKVTRAACIWRDKYDPGMYSIGRVVQSTEKGWRFEEEGHYHEFQFENLFGYDFLDALQQRAKPGGEPVSVQITMELDV